MFSLFVQSLFIILVLLTPFVSFALVIHLIERITQRRLAERFGWKSVLWTGWLGTPIHELSHALMCWVFTHRIDEIALFEPDFESGRLGYVRHSFRVGNWYQEAGNLFIGIAPLMSGSISLVILMWIFYPDPLRGVVNLALAEEYSIVQQMIAITGGTLKSFFEGANFLTARFWVFVYLVLCVGSHMAPSPSDYRGASRGVVFVGGFFLLVATALAAFGFQAVQVGKWMLGFLGPLFAVFGLAIVLCGLAAAIVYLITAIFPQRYVVGD
ncbi:MAG: hypothetical protein AAF939_05390 [Planctomycetota bacterium]